MVECLQASTIRFSASRLLPITHLLFVVGLTPIRLLALALLAPLVRQMVQIPQEGVARDAGTLLQLTQASARGVRA
jgi:hypothetical protein